MLKTQRSSESNFTLSTEKFYKAKDKFENEDSLYIIKSFKETPKETENPSVNNLKNSKEIISNTNSNNRANTENIINNIKNINIDSNKKSIDADTQTNEIAIESSRRNNKKYIPKSNPSKLFNNSSHIKYQIKILHMNGNKKAVVLIPNKLKKSVVSNDFTPLVPLVGSKLKTIE